MMASNDGPDDDFVRRMEETKKDQRFDEIIAKKIKECLQRSGRDADVKKIENVVKQRLNPRFIDSVRKI